MITLIKITKKYGNKTVVDQLNLTLHQGVVTGFLGPNGSGKSTTMKMIISLVRPTLGEVVIDGKKYDELTHPTKKIGTLIDPDAMDKNLTARQHLSLIATAANLDQMRVKEMMNMTGLKTDQHKQIKSISLGIKQRFGVATALFKTPAVVMVD